MKRCMAAIALAGLSLLGASPLWAADAVELTTRVSGVVSAVPGGPGTVVAADCQPRPLVILNSGRP